MKTNKKVSIIMNCRNGAKTLFEAINSVISQTYKNWEIIFFDNNSMDKSIDIANSFKDKRIKIFKNNKSLNLGISRFYASKKATGEYICFLDTDDIWLSQKLMYQLKFFKKKDIGIVYSNSIFFNDKRSHILYRNRQISGHIFRNLLNKYHISFDTVIFKKSFMDNHHIEIDKNFNVIHDLDLILRLSQKCKTIYCPKILSKWRMNEMGDSFDKKKIIIEEKFLLHEKMFNLVKEKKYKADLENFNKNIIKEKIVFEIFSKRDFDFNQLKKIDLGLKSIFLYIIYFIPFKKKLFLIIRKIFPTRLMFNL